VHHFKQNKASYASQIWSFQQYLASLSIQFNTGIPSKAPKPTLDLKQSAGIPLTMQTCHLPLSEMHPIPKIQVLSELYYGINK